MYESKIGSEGTFTDCFKNMHSGKVSMRYSYLISPTSGWGDLGKDKFNKQPITVTCK